MPLITRFRYHPEIDGLRAIAVVAVVLFHAGGFRSTGGYVGVDVSFVISGFLITSLIWKDLEGGRFTFAHFWERRARRIVPAMVVLTFATLVAGWFLLLPADYKKLGQTAPAPVLSWFMISPFGLSREAVAFNDAALSYVRGQHIPDVVLIADWSSYVESSENSSDSFDASLLATIRQLVAAGSRPWVMLDVPAHAFDVPRVLSRSVISHSDAAKFYTKASAVDEYDKIAPKTIAEMKSAGCRILDPKPRFLDPAGERHVFLADGVVLYSDRHRLTTRGAKLMLLPFFCDSVTLEN